MASTVLGLSAAHLQQVEEETCDCGAAGSGEGHTDWCKFVALGSWMERSGLSFATTPPPALEGVEEELLAYLQRITPGPWTKTAPERDFATGFANGVIIAATAPGKDNRIFANPPGGSYPSNDRDFIIYVRNHLPALLSALAGMRTENERLREALEEIAGNYRREVHMLVNIARAALQTQERTNGR